MKLYLFICLLVARFSLFHFEENNSTTNATESSQNVTKSSVESITVNTTTVSPTSSSALTNTSSTVPVSTTVQSEKSTTEAADHSSPDSTVTAHDSAESTASPAKSTGRQFHAPSFIGGIVLSVGLMAISYVGFKFYKSRTERNYHTLQESLHM